MEKIQLVVLGLSASPASNNAYALILKESEGSRRLPIIIGAFEAQAIALEMEGVVPPRPMTHDLMKSLIDKMGTSLTEVFINELRDGTFYAKLIFESINLEIDSRPSDAIALAVRCGAPIYVNSGILDETGLAPQEGEEDFPASEDEEDDLGFMKKPDKPKEEDQPKSKLEMLQMQLEKAIQEENYEKAAELRDELNKMTGSEG